MQLSMFQLDDPVLVQIRDQIKGLDINALTPIEALNKLNESKDNWIMIKRYFIVVLLLSLFPAGVVGTTPCSR